MEINFNDKNIVVTGAGQGIGNELCKRLVGAGANVFAISRSPGPLNQLKADCPAVNIILLDLSEWSRTRTDLKKALENITVHGLVNNAAIAIIKPFELLTEDDFDATVNVNLKAPFNVTQALLPNLVKGASIVNVSSLASFSAFPDHTVYSASKAALDALTRTLALELGPKGIRVNSVNPTVVLTKMGRDNWSDPAKAEGLWNRIPLHRFAEVKEAVDAIIYLLSDGSSFVNGHALPVDGGFGAS